MIHHTDEGEDIEFIEVYGDSVVKGERRTEIANEAWSIAQTLIMHHLTTLKAPTTERVEGIAEGVIRNPHTRRAREARRARFITVRPNAITPRTEHQGGAHASPVGHERRGHWRTYKTGKRTWVSAMSVNGGAVEGETRNYRVLAATGMVDDSFVKLAEGELSG
ncbi:hypothetical protein SAMN06297144_1848 [Sphingomonas guangdongensis]|uniref:Uncharacterized protein n=2 Tax=Sphingomonas guangdongensis TaxID=1141890 RepID=A0A285QZD6_9SPHN|nr:hypothetical protein SAMN06297144_1848 [Sphingomonas guangdongensis]